MNNDGDLAIDIAEDDSMETLLRGEMNKRGIDTERARAEEERRMLDDARQWVKLKQRPDLAQASTGATALHCAAVKGYHEVMLLVERFLTVHRRKVHDWFIFFFALGYCCELVPIASRMMPTDGRPFLRRRIGGSARAAVFSPIMVVIWKRARISVRAASI